MEFRGRDKDTGMPSTIGYNLPPKISTEEERRRKEVGLGAAILSPTPQALDHHHNHHHQLSTQSHQIHIPGGDANLDSDPAQLASPLIAGTSSSKALPLPPPPPQAQVQSTPSASNNVVTTRYRDCLKNHAASMGGHVVDGCGEFMPGGEEGTMDALKCAACECHRNFHRREIEGDLQPVGNCHFTHNPNQSSSRRIPTYSNQTPASHPTMPPHQQQQHLHKFPRGGFTTNLSTRHGPMMMAFGGNSGAPAESSSEDLNMFQSNAGAPGQPSFSASKKRFRTKFTKEQKDKMHEFAEKLEWKMQKQDDQEVQQFCNELGVKRQVFKVWMHNNKQAMKKKQL
ncbi:hypothetical protein RJ639_006494 [Escallonia herrerae]|uniref:Zinc finger-homeodomain protein 1 n=1 Tax=Escallonia herrerae TaxID=1293975 RepID=A0AA88VW67_9ASTE|nr:hypothetical protein RJ639_006494 [Escallonia herrerae]